MVYSDSDLDSDPSKRSDPFGFGSPTLVFISTGYSSWTLTRCGPYYFLRKNTKVWFLTYIYSFSVQDPKLIILDPDQDPQIQCVGARSGSGKIRNYLQDP